VTDPGGTRADLDGGDAAGPWRGTGPELAIAGVLVVAAAVAGYATAGWAGLSVVAIATTALAMLVLRGLLPAGTPDEGKKAREKRRAQTLTGYSHRRFVVQSAISSRGFYNSELRPVLEHLLAARLAERHGVNLYQDPAAARRLLCRGARDAGLWAWVDPETKPRGEGETGPRHRDADRRGIPRHTLVRLIDRLERL
jgi:hypothetical protein